MSGSKRVWRTFAILAVFGLIAAGCGDDDDSSDEASSGGDGEGSIWVLLPDTASSDRWEKDDRRFFAEAFEEAGLSEDDDYHIVNAEGDAATQQSQAEQAIADGASVIVLTSLDTGSGATIIDQAKDAGVKVVEYDRFNTGGSGGDAYVSFDNVQVGAAMADAMEPAIDALGLDPGPGRDAQRRRGGQQLVPVQAGLRGHGRRARRRRRLGGWSPTSSSPSGTTRKRRP